GVGLVLATVRATRSVGRRLCLLAGARRPAAPDVRARHRARDRAREPAFPSASHAGTLAQVAAAGSRQSACGGALRRDRPGRSHVRDALREPIVVFRSDLRRARACYSGAKLMASAILAAYLIGSIPFALMISRLWGQSDLRHVG